VKIHMWMLEKNMENREGSHARAAGKGKALAWVAGLLVPGLLSAALLAGCGGKGGGTLVFAATRDLDGFGVLEEWVEDFERRSACDVELVTAVDRDLVAMARHGECDVVLSHLSEETGMLERYGYVEDRQEVMRDTYLLVGPADDPARAGEAGSFPEAFTRIAEAKRPFVMRVDGSGAALVADSLWEATGVEDFAGWMRTEKGSMRETLQRASREGAYTFCDRSTYESMREELMLEVVYEGGEPLVNSYFVMMVSTLPYPDTNAAGAREFIGYLLSEKARERLVLGSWAVPPEEQ